MLCAPATPTTLGAFARWHHGVHTGLGLQVSIGGGIIHVIAAILGDHNPQIRTYVNGALYALLQVCAAEAVWEAVCLRARERARRASASPISVAVTDFGRDVRSVGRLSVSTGGFLCLFVCSFVCVCVCMFLHTYKVHAYTSIQT